MLLSLVKRLLTVLFKNRIFDPDTIRGVFVLSLRAHGHESDGGYLASAWSEGKRDDLERDCQEGPGGVLGGVSLCLLHQCWVWDCEYNCELLFGEYREVYG